MPVRRRASGGGIEAQYHFWGACSGLVLLLAGALPLLMVRKRRLRDVWPHAVVWLVLVAASFLVSRHADRLTPY